MSSIANPQRRSLGTLIGGAAYGRAFRRLEPALDTDAAKYLAAVEAADKQVLEDGVKRAVSKFVRACKADGNWDAIKASCILCGARTLAGALVPLKGAAPTKQGTEGGWDYSRTDGLSGNGTDNNINTNRKNNDDPTDNNHNYFWANTTQSSANRQMGSWPGSGANLISGSAGQYGFRSRTNAASVGDYTVNANSGVGMSRSDSTNVDAIRNGSVTSFAQSSQTANSNDVYLLGVDGIYATARVPFYSIGEAVDLALLDTAVSTLVSEIGAAV